MFRFKKTETEAETTPEDVQSRLAKGEQLLVLDVRHPDEYAEGHVTGSTLIPLDQLALRLDELPKDQEIMAICRSGNRSGVATGLLQRAGFKAINVKGGMLAWQKLKLPVERGT